MSQLCLSHLDMTFPPVGLMSDPSLPPQIEFYLLRMVGYMVPGTAVLLLNLNFVHTLGGGAVSQLHFIDGIAREEEE